MVKVWIKVYNSLWVILCDCIPPGTDTVTKVVYPLAGVDSATVLVEHVAPLLVAGDWNLIFFVYKDLYYNNFEYGRKIVFTYTIMEGGAISNRSEFIERAILALAQQNNMDPERLREMVYPHWTSFYETLVNSLPREGQPAIALMSGYFEKKQQGALNIKHVVGTPNLDDIDKLLTPIPLDPELRPGQTYQSRRISNVSTMAPGPLHDKLNHDCREAVVKLKRVQYYCLHGVVSKNLLARLEDYWIYCKVLAVAPADNDTGDGVINVKIYHDGPRGVRMHAAIAQWTEDDNTAIFYSTWTLVLCKEMPAEQRMLYRIRHLFMDTTNCIHPVPEGEPNRLIYLVCALRVKIANLFDGKLNSSRHVVEGPMMSVVSERGIHHTLDPKIINRWFKMQPGPVYTLFNWPHEDNLHARRDAVVVTDTTQNEHYV